MKDNLFLDSNILVYAYSSSEPVKKAVAEELINKDLVFMSTQVIQEFTNIITRKFNYSYNKAIEAINECCQNINVHTNTTDTILQACSIAERYKVSFYDSLIIAAALQLNCNILYSEDMHNGLVIDNKLTIMNPFL
jgi:predicted nucleic acid-binding protein